MIKLGSWLVVPGTPRCAAIDAYNCALIRGQRNDLRIFSADPPTMVVIAAASAPEPPKRFRAPRRFPRRGIGHINDVGIIRRHSDSHRARSTAADPVIVIDFRPGFAAVI